MCVCVCVCIYISRMRHRIHYLYVYIYIENLESRFKKARHQVLTPAEVCIRQHTPAYVSICPRFTRLLAYIATWKGTAAVFVLLY